MPNAITKPTSGWYSPPMMTIASHQSTQSPPTPNHKNDPNKKHHTTRNSNTTRADKTNESLPNPQTVEHAMRSGTTITAMQKLMDDAEKGGSATVSTNRSAAVPVTNFDESCDLNQPSPVAMFSTRAGHAKEY